TAEQTEIEARDKELREMAEERKALEARKLELEAEERAAAKLNENPAAGTEIVPENRKETKMEVKELRNTPEYIDAFAQAIKGDDSALRSILTENAVSGEIPIPEFAEERIRTAWETDEILNRVGKTYVKGNLKIGFEISGSDAVIHLEGGEAPDEEELHLGVVTLIPQSIKKWITVSDEALDMKSQEFVDYIYDELGHRIAKAAADIVVAKIAALPQTSTATTPYAALVKLAPSATTMVNAVANLSDEAVNNVAIMNKLTWADFKSITTGDGYPLQDPFAGLVVLFNNSLPAYSAASEDDVYAIVGDLGTGFRANFPNGEEIKIKVDDLSLAEADLVKFVGRKYVALEAVAPGRFTLITKPGA
ncbi:MAG: phage major capsid protein, partial [Clostridiales bacterium]|nr:phage major capsid protein [Clostridiales bacterium]